MIKLFVFFKFDIAPDLIIAVVNFLSLFQEKGGKSKSFGEAIQDTDVSSRQSE